MLAPSLTVNCFSDFIPRDHLLSKLPACLRCGLLMCHAFSDDDSTYYVCPSCRSGIEVPNTYLEEENEC